ncbi:pappalysin-1-like [Mytilus edulis]|uniref:pappalysin-1-like n=2 Tax=Mytilus edulis TaxID=6550 RepID=UPI0039EFA292
MDIARNNFFQYICIGIIIYMFNETNSSRSIKETILKNIYHKEAVVKEIENLRKKSNTVCTKPKRKGDKIHHLIRHPRDTTSVYDKLGTQSAVYFSGKEILKLKAFYSKIPSGSFTLSLLLNPEGGQHDPVTILELVDICNGKQTHNWLKIGIASNPEILNSGQKYFVTLKTERSKHASTVYTDTNYKPEEWTAIVVTYDKHVLKLYRDGALVAVDRHQHGAIFQKVSQNCKTILIGGDEHSKTFYRGSLKDLFIWNYAKNHSELEDSNGKDDRLFVSDSFTDAKKWRSLFKTPPHIIQRVTLSTSSQIVIKAPPCGETVCDDPVLLKSYRENSNLRHFKEINYKVYNLMNDDGSQPQITRKQLQKQHLALIDAFSPHNITFKQDVKNIKSTFLRQATVLYTCDSISIGDNVCDDDCFHAKTGYDGGDCDDLLPAVAECDLISIADGNCDPECNKFIWEWDGGDCCTPGSDVCFNPESQHRGYLSKDEFQDMVGEDSSSQLNIYLASTINTDVAGLSTYPWDKHVYGINGGVIVPPESFGASGKMKGLIHEIGHVLGLWHVHHGISEMDCDDPCVETHASLELGDLCSDTEPTPDNKQCHDPDGSIKSTCGLESFRNTPFNNYMSYADDSCINSFTSDQSARMHCYLDLVYKPWRTEKKPTPVPLPPKIARSTNASITISWISPLGSNQAFPKTICDVCKPDGSAAQYAHNATASHPESFLYLSQPMQAAGSPDSETCTASDKVWMMPDSYTCQRMECYIDLEFNFKFIPDKLSIWVPYTGSVDDFILTGMGDPIKFIEITTDDLTVIPLDSFPASCDNALSIRLNVRRPVVKVRIYVQHPYTAIDAAELSTSTPASECALCRQQKYRVIRYPEITGNQLIQTSKTEFTDRDIQHNTTYTYSILVVTGNHESVPSPSVDFIVGQSFCGDGHVNTGEKCDDGNTIDGDGCDIDCKEEEFFKCAGEPSHCFIHDGDGICEDFERPYSVTDCGYYTPPGFEDQWAKTAVANPEFQDDTCPESLIIGIPSRNQKCVSNTVPDEYWSPCNNYGKEDNYWIEIYFGKPKVATEIIIHFGSDGLDDLNRKQLMRIELITNDNITKTLTPAIHSISCKHNPIHVPIIHDLTQQFFLTKGVRIKFSSPRISIAGARLRSSKFLDPVTIASCDSMELYDPSVGRCFNRSCNRPVCGTPRVKHGVPMCNGKREGSVCTVKCNQGYVLEGRVNELICVNGTWQSYTSLSCVPVDCGEPYIPYASISCPDGFQYGDKCNFNCKAPSRLQGDVSTIQCDSEGTWSLPNSFCQIHCKAPSVTDDARLMTKACKRGYHGLGKVCKFKCEKEFHVVGKSNFRKIYKLECDEDGLWKGETCVPITCPPPDIVFQGLYRCTDLFNVGSTCTMICPDNPVTHVINCGIDGTWNNSFSICKSSLTGSCPTVAESTKVKFNCHGNKVGDQCDVDCFLPEAVPIVNGHSNKVRGRLASITDSYQDKGPVRHITCSVLLEWTPDPETITCKAECNKSNIADGLCQANYNTKECSWDGGDCCKSTVFDGFVLSIPSTCGKPCSCLDPNAAENRTYKHHIKASKKKSRSRLITLSRYAWKHSFPRKSR